MKKVSMATGGLLSVKSEEDKPAPQKRTLAEDMLALRNLGVKVRRE